MLAEVVVMYEARSVDESLTGGRIHARFTHRLQVPA
jgi:hypothetical protein